MIKGKVVKGVDKAVKPAKWSDWIDHTTDGIPSDITRHSYVEVYYFDGRERSQGCALEFSWLKEFTKIIRYRYKIQEDEPLKFDSQMKIDEKPKQDRYKDKEGRDLIDRWAVNFEPAEFRVIMWAMMEKYQARLGKKDDIKKEVYKIADYAQRWLEYENKLNGEDEL